MHIVSLRPAIAMIELIFALLIMGIVMMSAPMLISTASKSSAVSTQQEAINEAAAQLNMILGFHWDEQDTDERYPDPLLIVDSTTTDLNVSGTSARRSGTPSESFRAYVREDGVQNLRASSTLTKEEAAGTEEDDMDDFHDTTVHLALQGVGTAGYVETTTVNIKRDVIYMNDDTTQGGYNHSAITYNPTAPSAVSSNIKAAVVTLTSSSDADELQKNIVLAAFACNIGGYKLDDLDMP